MLGASAAVAALIRGEKIGVGQKALIAAVLLGAPGYVRRSRPPVAPVIISGAGSALAAQAVGGDPDYLRRDIALRPTGPDGHMAPARFRIVSGQLQAYTLRQDGSWALTAVPASRA